MAKYKVGDLFQAKTGFMGEWINNKTFVIIDVQPEKEDPYLLYCQENSRTLNTTSFTLTRDMVKIG
jgi:hypothetical protein